LLSFIRATGPHLSGAAVQLSFAAGCPLLFLKDSLLSSVEPAKQDFHLPSNPMILFTGQGSGPDSTAAAFGPQANEYIFLVSEKTQ
jgi:hypothetical protein